MKYTYGKEISLVEVKDSLTAEFKKPKSKSWCNTELKEIKKKLIEMVWEFDQKFKTPLGQVSFDIAPKQHQEWFIIVLLPHII